jgi:thiamine monophosphate synthase
MKQTRQDKQLDKQIESIYRAHCHGVQIPIMAIGSIYAAARAAAVASGGDVAAMTNAILGRVAEIRVN